MRNNLFWSLWCNIYCSLFVFVLYYWLCEQYFVWSDLWNMIIVIPLFIYILHFNVDSDNFIYRDNYSDLKILQLKIKKWYKQWKKK